MNAAGFVDFEAAYMEGLNMSALSVKQHLASLRGLFNWFVVKRVVPENPAMGIQRPIRPVALSRFGRTQAHGERSETGRRLSSLTT